MDAVCIIPARGGSKGIPRKNLAEVGGRSLVARAVHAALAARCFAEVLVSTDDFAIGEEAARAGGRLVVRPAELATGLVPFIQVVQHAITAYAAAGEEAVVAVVQPTSPFCPSDALAEAVGIVAEGIARSAFAATHDHTVRWDLDADGSVHRLDRDRTGHYRRQEAPRRVRETGAFYVARLTDITGRSGITTGLFSEPVAPVIVPAWTAIEIDDPHDLDLARAIARDTETR